MHILIGEEQRFEQEKALVTVVILTYQKFATLPLTLQSVLKQNYPSIEIILSDDGSEVFPFAEIQEWLRKGNNSCPTPITILHSPCNRGIVQNAKIALTHARGRYIKFLSPGDMFLSENSLNNLVSFAEKTNCLIITSISAVYTGDSRKTLYNYPSRKCIHRLRQSNPEQAYKLLARRNCISAPATMYHREYFEQYGIDETYKYLDDWPVWLSFSRLGGSIGVLEEVTTYYLVDGTGTSSSNAFDSRLLRDDLRHCYEKEIVPFISKLNVLSRWVIGYRYASLRELSLQPKERIVYAPLILYDAAKRLLKRIVLKHGRNV